MAMSHPVNLSNDGSTIRTTKMKQKKEKVTETAAAEIHASNDIQYADFPELFTSPIHVISMNVGHRVRKGISDEGNAPRRKKLIADVVMSNEPDLLLFQEFKTKGITWKDTHLPDHYVYTGHTEASIMYDTRRFQLTELSEVSQDFTPLARSSIQLLETKGPDKFKVLVVSWHGLHMAVDKEEKMKQFQDLQIYLKKLSERENADILLGGDFNIEMSLIKSFVLPEFTLYDYTPSERRNGKLIDYFMASPELTLADVGYIDLTKTNGAKDAFSETKDVKDDLTKTEGAKDDLTKTAGAKDDKEKDTKTQDPYRLFDHDPISATVVRRKALEKGDPLPKTLETAFSGMTLDSNN